MAVALRLAFDGPAFSGSQRQPGVRTVDGDLLAAFDGLGAEVRAFRPVGRTDAGVSASGYVVAVETSFPSTALCGALTSLLRDAWCTARAEVPDGYDPRRAARSRTYRYFLPAAGLDPAGVREALALFAGEHDFSAFARLEPHRSPRRRILRTQVEENGGFLVLEVEGDAFLWNQVRRMVVAAAAVGAGRTGAEVVRRALEEGKGPDLGLAPAEGLLLVGADLGLSWHEDAAVARRAAVELAGRRGAAALRARALTDLERSAFPTGGDTPALKSGQRDSDRIL